ncbi:MAG: hypothetical protein ABDH32_06080 [Candidatus Caldarchaeales archaeon]
MSGDDATSLLSSTKLMQEDKKNETFSRQYKEVILIFYDIIALNPGEEKQSMVSSMDVRGKIQDLDYLVTLTAQSSSS